jgi:hypothetical protein
LLTPQKGPPNTQPIRYPQRPQSTQRLANFPTHPTLHRFSSLRTVPLLRRQISPPDRKLPEYASLLRTAAKLIPARGFSHLDWLGEAGIEILAHMAICGTCVDIWDFGHYGGRVCGRLCEQGAYSNGTEFSNSGRGWTDEGRVVGLNSWGGFGDR